MSKSCATGFSGVLDVLDDQTIPFVLLRSTRIPSPVTLRIPERSLSGAFLLATQTTISGDITYHIPTYRLLELPGLKNPNWNDPPAETKVPPSLMDWLAAVVSCVMEVLKREKKKEQTKRWVKVSIDFLMVYLFSFGESSIYIHGSWDLSSDRSSALFLRSLPFFSNLGFFFFLTFSFFPINVFPFLEIWTQEEYVSGSPIPLSANGAHGMWLQKAPIKIEKTELDLWVTLIWPLRIWRLSISNGEDPVPTSDAKQISHIQTFDFFFNFTRWLKFLVKFCQCIYKYKNSKN